MLYHLNISVESMRLSVKSMSSTFYVTFYALVFFLFFFLL